MNILSRKKRLDPLCENTINCKGHGKRCLWLRRTDSGWYYCTAFGFRYCDSGIQGICRRNGLYIYYDRSLLEYKKCLKWNFCIYRLFGPILLLFSILGIKQLIEIVLKLINIQK